MTRQYAQSHLSYNALRRGRSDRYRRGPLAAALLIDDSNDQLAVSHEGGFADVLCSTVVPNRRPQRRLTSRSSIGRCSGSDFGRELDCWRGARPVVVARSRHGRARSDRPANVTVDPQRPRTSCGICAVRVQLISGRMRSTIVVAAVRSSPASIGPRSGRSAAYRPSITHGSSRSRTSSEMCDE